MIEVTLNILPQIILSSLRFAQECFKVKIISKSHNRAITRRYGLAMEASYSLEYRSLLSRNVFVYVYKLKQRRNTDFLFREILTRREWVIRVGPEFYLILDQNDQDISFSILYDLLL